MAYRTMPGMSLPVQVLDGRAADLLVERLPGDGDWAGRFARESTRLAAAPWAGKASRCWRSACCWTPPEDAPGAVAGGAGVRRRCGQPGGAAAPRPGEAGPASADEGAEALLFQHFSEWANEALAGEDGESASGYWREQASAAAENPLARRTTSAKASGRRGACCRARCSNAWPPTACRRRPPCWPGPRSPGSSRATRDSRWNGATGLGAPVQRVRRAGRTVRRGRAAVPGECPRGQRRRAARRPPGGDPRPGGGSGPARSLCPRRPLAGLGFAWLAGRTGWRRGGRAGLPSAAAGRVPRVAGAAPRRRQAGQPAGPSRP
ncbi:hypothetical protein P4114_23950 [Pseudomonas aeruginosa]|nr:hypothetical protein [Pseudomonas aeruginosa]